MLNDIEIVILAFIAIIFAFLLYIGKSLDNLWSKIDYRREMESRFRQSGSEKKLRIDSKSVKVPHQNFPRLSEAKDEISAQWLQRLQYFQQFFNRQLSPEFILEFREYGFGGIYRYSGPYDALIYDIYRGDLQVGRIEVTRFSGAITVELQNPEFYKIREIRSLLFACASAHYPAGPSQSIDRMFDVAVTRALIGNLWDGLHDDMVSRLEQYRTQWPIRNLVVAFEGEFLGYDHYCVSAKHERKNLLQVELIEVRERAQRAGYTVLESHDEQDRPL